MLRSIRPFVLSLVLLSCGAENKSSLRDVGSDLDPTKRTMEVLVDFPNDEILDRQLRLLSRAAGLTETLGVTLYGAIDLEGEYVEFLSKPGLKYGNIVREGSVFKLTTFYLGDRFDYKINGGLPKTYEGQAFEQGQRDDALIAISGYPGTWTEGEQPQPTQTRQVEGPKKLIFLCKNMLVKQLNTEDWLKMGCDLNVVNGKLQLSYQKTVANPQGKSFVFETPAVL